jgi:NAD(P)-dependent dehydrogenase (short-subunit alcohol dehydrogenase family)
MAMPDTGGELAVINRQHPGRAYHQGNIFGLSSLQTSSGEPLVQAWLTEPIESVVARFGHGSAMLTAMRSAVEALAPVLALELVPVCINAVTPGLIDTPWLLTADGVERDTIVHNRAAMLSGKRVGTADEGRAGDPHAGAFPVF